MITDKEMIELGFTKQKVYGKVDINTDTMCWQLSNGFRLMLKAWNNDDYFTPTLCLEGQEVYYKDIKDVEKLLKALFMI